MVLSCGYKKKRKEKFSIVPGQLKCISCHLIKPLLIPRIECKHSMHSSHSWDFSILILNKRYIQGKLLCHSGRFINKIRVRNERNKLTISKGSGNPN
jgi:hypothetical protein